MSLWPWWAGALFLGTFAVVFLRLVGRPFAVSGSWSRVLRWRERDVSEADLEAALLAATEEEFGLPAGDAPVPSIAPSRHGGRPANATWAAQAVFLASIVVGGAVAAITSGRFALRTDLGPDFQRIVGGGIPGFAALLVGGVLVGFGTRMAGGCTSGHGLNGCARLQPASLLATASFFGAGVVTSLLLGWMA